MSETITITCLVENTVPAGSHLISAHGLSFLIEKKLPGADSRFIMLDAGPSDALLSNSRKLGIDLSLVDCLVLSHGHYDHSGGILPFTRVNKQAGIIMLPGAAGNYYNEAPTPHYIGIDPEIPSLKTVKFSDGLTFLGDGFYLFSGVKTTELLPRGNRFLTVHTTEGTIPDDFSHEQYLAVNTPQGGVLLSGCAHRGIINILNRYREIFGSDPAYVFSGFHTMNRSGYLPEDIDFAEALARKLLKYDTVFYTGHCTDTVPGEAMKAIMGSRLLFLTTGLSVSL